MVPPPEFRDAAARMGAPLLALLLCGAVAYTLVRLRAARRQFRGRRRARLRQRLTRARELQRARTAADAANRAKSDFLVSISHEIRTPLNAVQAAADAVLRMPLDRVQRTQVTRIMNESTRLGRTLNDVLDLRRIEDGQIVLQRVPVAPAEIAREVVGLFAARAAEKGLQLHLAAEMPAGQLVTGDPRRLRQTLANLVDNGIKFTQRGMVTVTVSYTPPSAATAMALLTMAVRDTGVGITAEQRASLFAGNTTRATTAGMNAPGLGLVLAQRLVRLMGGEITVHSVAESGSEFAFTLPVTALNVPEAAVEPAPAPHLEGRRRVLIVDDVAANRIMLQMFLEQQGFSADYASGGEEAVHLAGRNHYDAILMDLQMPVVDGYTATQRIRAAERADRRAVIVAVTASGDSVTRQKCASAGMDGHFSKPLQLQKFCAALTDLIATRQCQQELESLAPATPSVGGRLPQTRR